MNRRIVGLETEYGCLIEPPLTNDEVVAQVRNWVFTEGGYGLLDVHDRGWDEPAGNGGFLFNGGRLYLDMGHVEYCTPECLDVTDVLRYDQAGDMILLRAVEALGWEGRVSFIRNNIDHYTGATFGCHENYSLRRDAELDDAGIASLLAFLTLRTLLTGSGRVGSLPALKPPFEDAPFLPDSLFQISQRADYIRNDFYEWVQFNRAIVNTRDEPLADPRSFRRLHLLHGDSSVLPATLFLKIASTRLVLDLMEAGELPRVELREAVGTLRALSRITTGPWPVTLADGQQQEALALLRLYHEKAAKHFRQRAPETEAALALWSRMMQALESDKPGAFGLLDWVTKETLLNAFCTQENIPWDDPWLKSQDLEFHHIHPQRSLAHPLADRQGCWHVTGVEKATLTPPSNTRAHLRSKMMRELCGQKNHVVDWYKVGTRGQKPTLLLDPFQTEPGQA
ncbi:MAG: proteasome accessory factor PafA2 family protein [Verrucomicrobiae bacterium]|nr:proteasome accessory factor PafA2 family protein [Verrucomicrobiae bacterium]